MRITENRGRCGVGQRRVSRVAESVPAVADRFREAEFVAVGLHQLVPDGMVIETVRANIVGNGHRTSRLSVLIAIQRSDEELTTDLPDARIEAWATHGSSTAPNPRFYKQRAFMEATRHA